jgi:hypothetical protein
MRVDRREELRNPKRALGMMLLVGGGLTPALAPAKRQGEQT